MRHFFIHASLRPVFHWDAAFTKRLLLVALPIMFQNLVASSLHIIDGIMVSGLGTPPYAAVTQMSRFMFLFQLTLFGVVSGSSIFLSQFWGKKDVAGMRSVMSMCLRLTLPLALLFGGVSLFAPRLVVGFFLDPGESAEYARQYLMLVAPGMLFTAVDTVYASAMKSSEKTYIPMMAGIAAIVTNTVLNYILIYGKLGLPAMGIRGAAIATLIAGGVSLTVNVSVSYSKRLASAAKLNQLLALNGAFFRRYLKTIFPVILNESFWALGITVYSSCFGRLGDTAVAAQGIYSTVDQLIFVMIYGLMHGSAIVMGRSIGAGEREEAYLYARRLLFAAVCLGLFMGTVMFSSRFWLVTFFNISKEAQGLAAVFLGYASFFAWAKAFNCINIVGVLRSGGDTVFSMALDVGSIWCFGVPLVALATFVFRWPVEIVFLCTAVEEVPKIALGLKRMLSKKWINDLTRKPMEDAVA